MPLNKKAVEYEPNLEYALNVTWQKAQEIESIE